MSESMNRAGENKEIQLLNTLTFRNFFLSGFLRRHELTMDFQHDLV